MPPGELVYHNGHYHRSSADRPEQRHHKTRPQHGLLQTTHDVWGHFLYGVGNTEPQRLSSRNKRQQSKNTTVKPTPAMRRCIRNNAMDPWTYRDVHALLYSGFRVGWIKEPTSTHE
ncbi:hypothetical protein HYE67_009860 [Fusarium culmorum]|uniref:Uncharacterized protein n=1 Tax=Fusarium culmorum TaxID=5516 RepID=A0A7S8I0U0_FUSCU|nr:hypothetical protein HYE67_009860 [Fusarium culmorum]